MKSTMTFENDQLRTNYHLKMGALMEYAQSKLGAVFPAPYDQRFSPQIVMFWDSRTLVFEDIHHFEAWLHGNDFDPLTHAEKMYQYRRAFEDNMTNYGI